MCSVCTTVAPVHFTGRQEASPRKLPHLLALIPPSIVSCLSTIPGFLEEANAF